MAAINWKRNWLNTHQSRAWNPLLTTFASKLFPMLLCHCWLQHYRNVFSWWQWPGSSGQKYKESSAHARNIIKRLRIFCPEGRVTCLSYVHVVLVLVFYKSNFGSCVLYKLLEKITLAPLVAISCSTSLLDSILEAHQIFWLDFQLQAFYDSQTFKNNSCFCAVDILWNYSINVL